MLQKTEELLNELNQCCNTINALYAKLPIEENRSNSLWRANEAFFWLERSIRNFDAIQVQIAANAANTAEQVNPINETNPPAPDLSATMDAVSEDVQTQNQDSDSVPVENTVG